jgi:serine protease AprX
MGLNIGPANPRHHNRNRGWGIATLVAIGATLAMPLASSAATTFGGPLTLVNVRGSGPGCTALVAAEVRMTGGHMTRTLAVLYGGTAEVPAGALNTLAHAPCVAEVTPDSPVQFYSIGGYDPTSDAASLYSTTQMIGAQNLWKNGATGKGVGVALVDTGVAPVLGLSGSGQVVNGPDLSFASQAQQLIYNDEYGHGTHMAGIIGGNDVYGTTTTSPDMSASLSTGAMSASLSLGTAPASSSGSQYAGNTSNFIGVAPDAHILNMKVADESGVADISQVIAAIDWVVAHRNDNGLNIRVINLSFGTNSTQSYALDPLAFSAEFAWRSGIVVVAAVGNFGSTSNGVSDPAYDPYLLAVGAADTQKTLSTADDTVASFSSVGNGVRNPDLVAPGVHIASLRDPGSNIDLHYGATATVADRFFRGSGSSMATAVVSGAVADLISAYPKATPDQIKWALTTTARSLNGQSPNAQGAGELNLSGALKANFSRFAPQSYTPSSGLGSLESARGGTWVTANNVALQGDKDIFGNPWNAQSIVNATLAGTAWSGGVFNGTAWSGTGWSGTGWSGTAWSGTAWSGTGWSGTGWSGSTWSGTGWSGTGWSGTGWSGTGWSGTGWSGTGWSGTGWSGTGWSGTGWSGADWS